MAKYLKEKPNKDALTEAANAAIDYYIGLTGKTSADHIKHLGEEIVSLSGQLLLSQDKVQPKN